MTDSKWYFDTKSGEVAQGKKSGWDTRMGPYDTEEEARQALRIAAARTEAADEWDEEEDED